MPQLKIGFDAKRAFHNRTGLGNYSRAVINGLRNCFPENDYVLFTPKKPVHTLFEEIKQSKNVSLVYPKSSFKNPVWRLFSIPSLLKENDVQIYHGLSAELPLAKPQNVKYIVTVHDLIFERFPDLYSTIDRKIYRYKTKQACEIADKIIATSEQTKKDLIHYFGIDQEKIKVVYQGCSPIFEQQQEEAILKKVQQQYQLPQTYILNVGTLEKRKNAALILMALVHLPAHIHAVFIGRKTSYQQVLEEIIATNGLEKRVHFLSNIPNEDLPAIYQQALVFAYPSIFEGFGIPIIEALKSRVPVIAATGSCLEEAGGENSLYLAPEDTKTLSDYVLQLATAADFRQQIVEKGFEFSQRFSSAQLSKDTMDVYLSVL